MVESTHAGVLRSTGDKHRIEHAVRGNMSESSLSEATENLPLERYRIDYTVPEDSVLFKAIFRVLGSCMGANWAAKISKEAHEGRLPSEDIWSAYVRHIGVNVEVRGFDTNRIPKSGPLVFVANHPTGMVDAHILGSIIEKCIRTDAKFISLPRFCQLPALKDRLIPVYLPSPSGRTWRDAERLNAESREAAFIHVQDGGAIVIFPSGAGGVRAPDGTLLDNDWRHGAFALVAKTGAKVVPVHLDAPSSPMRRWTIGIHPALYDAAAPYDAMYLRGKTATLTFGDPDSAELKEALSDLSTAPNKVRELVYRLPERA